MSAAVHARAALTTPLASRQTPLNNAASPAASASAAKRGSSAQGAAHATSPSVATSTGGAPPPAVVGREQAGKVDALLRTTRRVATVSFALSAVSLGVYVGLPVLLPELVAVGSAGKFTVLAASWACVLGACTFVVAATAWALLRLGRAVYAQASPAHASRPVAAAARPLAPPRPASADNPPPALPAGTPPIVASTPAAAARPKSLDEPTAELPRPAPPTHNDAPVENASPSADTASSLDETSRSPSPGISSAPSPSVVWPSTPCSPRAAAPDGAETSPWVTPLAASPASGSSHGSGRTRGPGGSGSDGASSLTFYTPLVELPRDGAPSEGFTFADAARDLDPQADQLAETNAQLRLEVEALTAELAEHREQTAADAAAQRREVAGLRTRLQASTAELAALAAYQGRIEADRQAQAANYAELRNELAAVHAENDELLRERQGMVEQGTAAERRRQAQRQRDLDNERDREREVVEHLQGRVQELERRTKSQAGEVTTLRARLRRQDGTLAEREAQVVDLERHLDAERNRRPRPL